LVSSNYIISQTEREFLILEAKKCCIYAVLGVLQMPKDIKKQEGRDV
jgi:hypothetical protein